MAFFYVVVAWSSLDSASLFGFQSKLYGCLASNLKFICWTGLYFLSINIDLHLFPLSLALLSCAFSPILPISINSLEKSLFKSLGVILESQEILCPPIQKWKYYRHRIAKMQGLYVFLYYVVISVSKLRPVSSQRN